MGRFQCEKVGFIGLGNMGSPMALNLAKWLHENGKPALTLWNRTSSKLPPTSQTIAHAQSPRELARTCDVVVTSLANDEAAEQIYAELFEGAKDKRAEWGEEGEARATIFCETSTLYPKTSGKLETTASKIPWCFYLQTPVFGPPSAAKEAKLVTVLSGDIFAKRHVEGLLVPSMARKIIDVGANVERAATFKLLGNSVVIGVIELLAESMTLADKSGVGSELLYEFIKEFLPAPSFIGYGKKILENSFEGETGFTATGGLKDAQHIQRLATEHGATVPALDVAHRHLVTAIAHGGGDLDWSSLVAGPRLAAGLSPFTGRKDSPHHDTGFGSNSNEAKGNLEPESVGGIKEVKNF
ncbi:NAD(P)-dependent oxidoreductase [Sporobolomyces salmoneus]|uniref:NAD(P)-dependent oxidoreductase n=1 Tax=Sporobolomyces salmoneus TaxID=183962 RepID=UPI00317094DC